MTLLDHHCKKLLACGLTLDTWTRAGLHSGSEAEVREVLGYGGAGTGLVIPYADDYARVRIDNPGPDGKRYRSPKGAGNRLYVPKTLAPTILSDPTQPLYVTEREFKTLKATQDGFPCVALPGVWSWKTRLHGQSLPIPDLDRVTWPRRRTILVFDSDLADKPSVAWAEHFLCQELRQRGAEVYVLRLPSGPADEKYGLDDFLVARGSEEFRRLPMMTPQEADQEAPALLRVTDLADAYLLRVLQPHHRIHLGYPQLDAVIRGVAPGEVMQILGRSGVGKTAFGLNLVERMTADGQLPTLIFSLEMPGVELFERMASMTIGWPGREIEDRARMEDPKEAFLSAVLRDGAVRAEEIPSLARVISERRYLFDADLTNYLEEIQRQAVSAFTKELLFRNLPVGNLRTTLVNQHSELVLWMTEQPAEVQHRFERYLKITV